MDMIARNELTAPGDGRFRAIGRQTDAANADALNVLRQTRLPGILGEIVIVAVAHLKRKPGYWKGRV